MKKILVFEYITGGGLIDKEIDHSMLNEANIIIESLIDNKNINVNFFTDYRHKYKKHKNSIIVSPENKNIIYDAKLINSYDYFLPICPETDLILYKYIKRIQPYVKNMIISSLDSLLVASDKFLLKQICKKNNILNPDLYIPQSKNFE